MSDTDISVHDKEVSALGATVEAQDRSTRARQIVPMPQFTDPNNPEANSGSVNMSLEANGVSQHPVEHSPDYGAGIKRHDAAGAIDPYAREGAGGQFGQPVKENDTPTWPSDLDMPAEGDSKGVWEETAHKLGLSKSGTKADLIKRVTDHKTAADEAADDDS